MFRCIIIFFLLSHTIAFSQDWALFPYGQKSMYLKQDTAHTFEVLVADSLQGETYYFNRKVDLPIDQDCINNVYAYYYSGSYITVNDLDSIIETTDTTFFYCSYTDVPFIFLKHAPPGDSWVITSDNPLNTISAIEITCIDAFTDDVLGFEDSIKLFQLAVVDNPDAPLNDYTIALSKNFGLIDFIFPVDFIYNPAYKEIVPYKLIGFESPSDTAGYVLPNWKNYFSLHSGDKLFWKYTITTAGPTTTTITKYFQDSLTEVIQSDNEITYIYDRKVLDFISDVFVQHDLSESFSSEMYQWFVNSPTNWFTLSNDHLAGSYGPTIWQNTSNALLFTPDFLDTTVTRNYATGVAFLDTIVCFVSETTDVGYDITINSYCGITSYGMGSGGWFTSYESQKLIGFNINDSIWGATSLPTSIQNVEQYLLTNIYPNPASDFIFIDIPAPFNYHYYIYTYTGKLIDNGMLTENRLDVAHLQQGMYFLQLKNDNGIAVAKFVKQ